jgi:hypothetical protein
LRFFLGEENLKLVASRMPKGQPGPEVTPVTKFGIDAI